jgi:very-short-patch-repair endonuclease
MPFDINAQIDAWRALLLDTTKRNRLINFKVGRTGGIAIVHPDPGNVWHSLVTTNARLTFAWKRDLIDLPPDPEEAGTAGSLPLFDHLEAPVQEDGEDVLARCRHSPRLRPDHLLTELSDRRLAGRLNRLALNSRESLAEQGVATLYVAFGILRWFESPDSQVEVRSPLLLVPVRLDRESIQAPWRLQAEDEDVLSNHTLAQLLANDVQLRLPDPGEEAPDGDDSNWRTRYFGAVQRCVRHQPRWEVLDEVALGTFSFQKLAMWDDLGRNRDRLAPHDLCRAVAGDPGVQLRCPADLPKANELDRQAHPNTVFHILPADSSQHEAIAAATRGASLVLDGPPGTGKSQTIANLIAEFLAAGKTVLFVSEKAAALEVVQRRLQDRGLGDFCLACHSHKANKRDVVAELSRCLDLPPQACRDPAHDLQHLYEVRRRLNDYVRELHAPRAPLGMTVFQVQGELARLARLTGASRCPVPDVLNRDAAYLRRATELLARLPDCQGVIADPARHPWRGCRATVYSPILRDDVRHHFGRLAACLDRVADAVAVLHARGFGAAQPTPAQWRGAVTAARTALSYPAVPAPWFQGDTRAVAEAVVRLDDLSQAFRRIRAGMPEFAAEALRRADPASLAALSVPAGELALLARPGDTLHSLRERLASLGTLFGELQRRAAGVDEVVQRVGGLLRAPRLSTPLHGLARLVELAGFVAGMGPVRRSWWDAGRRRELLTVFTRSQEETDAAQKLRAELATRLSPRAFAPENAALGDRAGRLRWWMACLRPAWRSFKDEVSGWYAGQVPGASGVVDDLGKLASYHRRTDYCRQVEQQYAADLLVGDDGGPDWAGTLEALRSVDRLEQLTKVPPALQAALSEGDGVDRPALATAARSLAEQHAALRQHLEALAREYDLAEVMEGATGKVRLSARDLVSWLQPRADTAARQVVLLDRVAGLLAEGRDVPAEALPERVNGLAELGRIRERVAGLCARIWPGQPLPPEPEEKDWSVLRRSAAALLRLLDAYRGALPAPVVGVLTTPAVRNQLAEAVRKTDEACGDEFEESWRFLAGLFELTRPVSTGITIEATPLADLGRWLTDRTRDAHRLQEWIRFGEIERQAAQEGVGPVLAEALNGRIKPEDAPGAFRVRFLGLWLDAVHEQVPALRGFATEDHERLIERFRELDRLAVASAAARIRAFQLSRPDRPRAAAGEAPGSSEVGVLQREAKKRRRHLPLRKLFASVPSLLLWLKPCVMMSPLAVSTYLDTRDICFDLVIFDEASQVRPHDAICANYRGRQVVVAGDNKQLPPTSFFDRALEDEGLPGEDEGGLEDYESILDVCCTLGLLRRRLRWHYRSRREGLIAFSNQFVYGNELVTFPSVEDVAGNPAVSFEYVSDGRWKAGAGGGFNAVEARRTAELVLEHFRQHPGESLGVIAFSQRQQMRIQDELDRLRRAHPDLEEFFREDRDEPFFVKNLENVQGDEREIIFLGVGYGPDEVTGRVAMRFGPLNQQGGERRLNVAVTRARRRVTVLSSMRAHDIDLSRSGALGVKLLRAYLDYAERGPVALGAAITVGEHGFDSPFEQEVYEELTRGGLTVHPQVGCSGFRIDLAVVDPRTPGRYLLGVECDGATYHSSATARDRDRLRQEVLEGLGWRICRVWSTDWLRDREGQVRRVRAALDRAQREDPPLAPRTAPPGREDPPPAGRPAQGGAEAATVSAPAGPSYNSIEEVPEFVLREVLSRLLRAFGATEVSDLIQAVARELGFMRTGKRIQARIVQALEGLIQGGQVCRAADQRVQPAPRAASV